MCFSKPKTPPPSAAAPTIKPVEAPTLEISPDLKDPTKTRGTSQLRIDRTASRPDVGSGLNIPTN